MQIRDSGMKDKWHGLQIRAIGLHYIVEVARNAIPRYRDMQGKQSHDIRERARIANPRYRESY